MDGKNTQSTISDSLKILQAAAVDAYRAERALDDLRRERESQSSSFGLNRIIAQYEERIEACQAENRELKTRLDQAEKNRAYILSVLNFIKSSAFSIPAPAGEPDYGHEVQARIDRVSERGVPGVTSIGTEEGAEVDRLKRELESRRPITGFSERGGGLGQNYQAQQQINQQSMENDAVAVAIMENDDINGITL